MDYSISQLPNTNENLVFLKEEKPRGNPARKNIFENFSKNSLKTLVEACDIAKSFGSGAATPWHLLYALFDAPEALAKIPGQSISVLKNNVLGKIGVANQIPYNGTVFLSPELKKVLMASYFVIRQHPGSFVENVHLLFALSVYPEMSELFDSIGFERQGGDSFFIPKEIAEYTTDLTESSAKDNKDFQSRETEIGNILRIISRGVRHNVILLGDEGVGKSVVASGLAHNIANNRYPNFNGSRVLSLDVGSVFSLTNTSKALTLSIMDMISTSGQVIFFLENANLLTTGFQISQLVDFLQTLSKKANVYFILPSTPAYFKEQLSSNNYFSDAFEVVHINELSGDSTERILALESPRIEKQFKVQIDNAVYREVVALSKRYLAGRLPQKAISLLEEVAAGMFLKNKNSINIGDVRDIVSQKTGVPIHSLSVSEAEKLKNLEDLIAKYVIGQSDAITKVSEALRRARAGLKDAKRPIGSFLFLGPTGVGKTELAKTLAKLFFNDEKSFLRFDMSEYAESFTAQRLIGSPPGYVGYEEGGQLTNQVLSHPYSLILFDEIEKAHPRVFDLFLQMLDDGRLTDSRGTVVDFRNTLIIFTSNIASREIFDNSANLVDPEYDKKKFFDEVIMKIVRSYFRPELVNRFDDIVMFNPLTKPELIQIARLKIKQLAERLEDKKIRLIITDATLRDLVDTSFDPSFGARPLEREIRFKIENPLAKQIISGDIKDGDSVEL